MGVLDPFITPLPVDGFLGDELEKPGKDKLIPPPDAAKRGVRYAGMGQAHLDHLKAVGLPAGGHPFEMDGDDIKKFRDRTKALRAKAVKQ
jgi:hypothetical protein